MAPEEPQSVKWFEIYTTLVHDYTLRTMTYPSDAANAFARIVSGLKITAVNPKTVVN